MKKTVVVICAILVCLISIGLGFYFGRFSNTTDHVEESNFDKQSKCSALYDQYKDKTKNYGEIDELSVFYSPKEDSCLASYMIGLDTDKDGISDFYRFYIVDALKGDSTIFQCSSEVFKQDEECGLPMFKKLRYELAN